jgi:hypothetical protein
MSQCFDHLREHFSSAVVLHRGQDRLVIRLRTIHLPVSIVIKLWARTGAKGWIRRLARRAPADIEWRNLLRFSRIGIVVPTPLGRSYITPPISGYTEALCLEDLGDCQLSTDYLKGLLEAKSEDEAQHFESTLIDMTGRIIDAGIIDVDHSLANVLVRASGQVIRLDLELARRVYLPHLFATKFGEMIGRLVGMHAFAVQPDTARTERFYDLLCKRLRPSQRVLNVARKYANNMLIQQRRQFGIDTRLELR